MAIKFNPDLFKSITEDTKKQGVTVNKTKWDYIVEYTIDLRRQDDNEILERKYVILNGDMDSECYFSECVDNASMDDFLPKSNFATEEPGIYRLVYGVVAKGQKIWTAYGYDYDAWEEYEFLSQYKFTDKEVDICFSENKL